MAPRRAAGSREQTTEGSPAQLVRAVKTAGSGGSHIEDALGLREDALTRGMGRLLHPCPQPARVTAGGGSRHGDVPGKYAQTCAMGRVRPCPGGEGDESTRERKRERQRGGGFGSRGSQGEVRRRRRKAGGGGNGNPRRDMAKR